MTFKFSHLRILLFLVCLSLVPGCAPVTPDISDPSNVFMETTSDASEETESVDSSCSYFYFLWATHAENNRHYLEAEEALEKALICDPGSRHILRRLPILLIKMGKPYGAAKWLRKAIELYPDDSQDRLLLARLDIRNNETEEAIELYNELIRMNPDDETILLRLGSLYAEQKQTLLAKETFEKALSKNPESLFTHLYLARLALKTDDIEGAEKWYTKALTINWSTELAYEVAAFYETQENFKKVAIQYQAILKKRPDETRAGLGLVHSLLLQDREQEALAILQGLRLGSEDPGQIDIITARLYLRSKKLDKATGVLKKILAKENNAEAAYMLAVIRYQQKDIHGAKTLLRSIDPDSNQFEDGVYLQTRIFMEANQDDQALHYLQTLIEQEELELPGFYSLLASLYLEQKQIKKAYDLLDIALVKFPDTTQIYFEYGLLLEQDGNQQRAISLMEQVLEMNPDHAEALNYLAYTWADNNVHLDKAFDYVLQSMQLKPDNGYIMDTLAWVYFRMGKLDKANATILRALELEPEDPNIHEHQGDIYQQQGKEEEALQSFQDAERRFKKNSDKARLFKKIHALQ